MVIKLYFLDFFIYAYKHDSMTQEENYSLNIVVQEFSKNISGKKKKCWFNLV